MAGDDNPRSVLDLALPLAALLPHSPGPYIALMLAGFAIGILGHLTSARWLVAAGVDPDLPRRPALPARAPT